MLKVIGTVLRPVFQLPDYGWSRACLRGRTADTSPVGRRPMLSDAGSDEAFERRVIAAHAAYIAALTAYERLFHDAMSWFAIHEGAAACQHKETCRVAFRDLLDELGYLPFGLTAALPIEPSASVSHTSH